MPTETLLPATLNAQMRALVRRLRLVRTVQGLCAVLFVLTLLAGAAFLADHFFGLPRPARVAVLVAWLTLGTVLTFCYVLVAGFRRVEVCSLAALVEEKHPEFAERLTSAFEIAAKPMPPHGSPAFVGLVMQEAADLGRRTDFNEAVPARRCRHLVLAAAGAAGLTATAWLLWPERCSFLAGRFLHAWQTPAVVPAAPPYVLEVSPGAGTAALGRPLKITAVARAADPAATLPAAGSLLLTGTDGRTSRLPMAADAPGEFSANIDPVLGDFDYRIEAGQAASPEYHIKAIEPVEIADGTTVIVTPPPYARQARAVEVANRLGGVWVLQHSAVTLDLRFTRPALAGHLEWILPSGAGAVSKTARQVPLSLTRDGRSARVEFAARENGSYRLVLEAEEGILTDAGPWPLTAVPDKPPLFLEVPGDDPLRVLRPDDSVKIQVAVSDDVAVREVGIELRVNQGRVAYQTVPLPGVGTPNAAGTAVLPLAGKVKEGDEVLYRVKAVDNRSVPEAGLEPQVAYYPANGWRTVHVAGPHESSRRREITARSEDAVRRLEKMEARLAEATAGIRALAEKVQRRPAGIPQGQFSRECAPPREAAQEVVLGLEALPPLSRIDDIREQAAGQLRRAVEDLAWAAEDTDRVGRARQLQAAGQRMAEARRGLEKVRVAYEAAAAHALTAQNYEELTGQQNELARTVGTDLHRDADPARAKAWREEQIQLAQSLEQLVGRDPKLADAREAAGTATLQRLAARARALAQDQRDLAPGAPAPAKEPAVRADKQKRLLDQAGDLGAELRAVVQAAQVELPTPRAVARVEDAIEAGRMAELVERQEAMARDLEALARREGLHVANSAHADELALRQADLAARAQLRAARRPRPGGEGDGREEQLAVGRETAEVYAGVESRTLKERALMAQAAAARASGTAQVIRARWAAADSLRELADALAGRSTPAARAALLAAEQRRLADEFARGSQPGDRVARYARAADRQTGLLHAFMKLPYREDEAGNKVVREMAGACSALKPSKAPAEVRAQLTSAAEAAEEFARSLAGPEAGAPQRVERGKDGGSRPLADTARRLARRQEELAAAAPARGPGRAATAEAVARGQRELDRQIAALLTGHARQALQHADEAMSQALPAMEEAYRAERGNTPDAASPAQEFAAGALERAAEEMARAAGQAGAERADTRGAAPTGTAGQNELGRKLWEAREQMALAESRLSAGRLAPAAGAMARAGEALGAVTAGLGGSNGNPAAAGPPGRAGARDEAGEGFARNPGAGQEARARRWGDLPGELRTRLIQDAQEQYGEEYARMIKLYFERLADLSGK